MLGVYHQTGINLMKSPSLCLSIFLLVGCQTGKVPPAHHSKNPTPLPQTASAASRASRQLSAEQLRLVDTYFRFKVKVKIALGLGLSQSATWDDIRPKLAQELGLPVGASLENVLKHPRVASELTEEKRRAFAKAFALSEDSDWRAISDVVEKARLSE